jgi:2-polyprenyl-3-methyl-5-hydroxy-6-metoxy-1,4-benzoquinol methylase|tara:strand:- start:286 stop:1179 length:894 start_codon:yes stop_codon:yes gene_type:complete
VKQNAELIEIKNCPVCSETVFKPFLNTTDYFYTQEAFSLTQCENCDFVFTNPVPNNPYKYYETQDYLSHDSGDRGVIGRLYSLFRNINIKRKYELVRKYCDNGSILDIGCGTGELLRFFNKKNWSVTGIEPNPKAREFAISNYNLNVLDENNLDEFSPGTLDVISLWHVLEHVPDLHKRLSQINELLKDDGTIFIALPNLESPDSEKYKEYWSGLDVPRHLHHFTKTTFSKLISTHNMKIVHSEPMKFDSYYVSLLSEKYLKNRFYFLSAIYNGYISNLEAKVSNNYSSMIFVVKKQ